MNRASSWGFEKNGILHSDGGNNFEWENKYFFCWGRKNGGKDGANTINLWFCGRKLKDFLNDGFYFMKTEIKLFAKSDGWCDGIRGFRRAETILNPCREWERKWIGIVQRTVRDHCGSGWGWRPLLRIGTNECIFRIFLSHVLQPWSKDRVYTWTGPGLAFC